MVIPSWKYFCLPSKAAILITFWAATVGAVYYAVLGTTVLFIDAKPQSSSISISVNDSLPYAILAFVTMFYPLSGFIADVCCGRLKTVVISLCFLLVFVLLMCLVEIVVLTTKLNSIGYYNYSSLLHNEGIFVCLTALASLVLFIVGLAGYQTNFVQFGLDQLFEAPSHYLGLFVHYAMWAFHLGSMPLIVTIPLLWCDHLKRTAPQVLLTVPFILAFLLIILHTISRWKCNWFYGEPGWPNPYNTVFNVISFARKHKYPLRHSAFTYCDNYLPSRIDFAKERYGGPFSTEQVENVKTFLRILLVLFAMGPVFTLEVPASYFVFPLFSLHTLHYYKYLGKEFCTGVHTWETVVIGSGSLMTIPVSYTHLTLPTILRV